MRTHYVVVLLTLALLAVASVAYGEDTFVPCPGGPSKGGQMTLTADLVCTGSTLMLDSAQVNLNGHAVICPPPDRRCVQMTGKGSVLGNGTVRGQLETLALEGEGHHLVLNLNVTPSDGAILVTTSHNTMVNVRATSSNSPGLRVMGSHNILVGITAICPVVVAGGCLDLVGEHNVVSGSAIWVSEDDLLGFNGALRVTGDHNVVRSSYVTNADGPAVVIEAGSELNLIERNVLTGATVDARDLTGDCVSNTWRGNVLDSAEPSCLL
jgi:Right handed beta helix region